MTLEHVKIVANGRDYEEWESVRIEWIVDEAADTPMATLATSEAIERNYGQDVDPEDVFGKWNFPPGTFVTVLGNDNDLLMHGFVFAYMPAADAEQHSIQIVIKPLTWAFLNSSAYTQSMHFENLTDDIMMRMLAAPYGLSLEHLAMPSLHPWFQLKMGASNYAELMRFMQPNAKYMYTSREGALVVSAGEPHPVVGDRGYLVQGVNILKMTAKLTDEGYWMSEVIGQNPVGTDLPTTLQPRGWSWGVGQVFKIIPDQTATTPEKAQKLAAWVATRAFGRNVSAQITVMGWRKQDGRLWEINSDVYVYAPYLKIDCVMRVTKIVFSQAVGEGTTADLTLVDPKARGYNSFYACESGSFWRVPDFIGSLGGAGHRDPPVRPWPPDRPPEDDDPASED